MFDVWIGKQRGLAGNDADVNRVYGRANRSDEPYAFALAFVLDDGTGFNCTLFALTDDFDCTEISEALNGTGSRPVGKFWLTPSRFGRWIETLMHRPAPPMPEPTLKTDDESLNPSFVMELVNEQRGES